MIRVAFTAAAFDAIAATLRLGSVGYEPEVKANGKSLFGNWPLESRQSEKIRGYLRGHRALCD
jgi:hypothetical protein